MPTSDLVRHVTTHRRRLALGAAVVAVSLTAAACSSSSGGSSTDTSAAAGSSSASSAPASSVSTSASPAGATTASLASVCPSTIKIQTSWYPEAEKGAVYQIVGANGTVDKKNGTYSGTVDGVKVSILAGGPYLGNQSTMARLYQDPSIMFGEVSTDDAIEVSNKNPVIAVVAMMQKSPKAVIYDPKTYQFKTIADVGKSGATILKAGEDASTDLLVASGSVKASQLDYSYDGSPGRFVTAGGKDVFVEYATEVPYIYQNTIKQWGKPLDSILLADGGYTAYENSLAMTPQNEQKYSACLKQFVPIVQKAIVAYAADPTPVDNAMIKYSQEVKSPTVLSTGLNDFTNKTMKEKGILANGTDGTVGSFDPTRVTKLVASMGPVAKNQHLTIKPGLTATQLVTNQFLDPSISLPN
jgi:hypothetical protein